jgi:C-terminal processing protease CtpA/Prc
LQSANVYLKFEAVKENIRKSELDFFPSFFDSEKTIKLLKTPNFILYMRFDNFVINNISSPLREYADSAKLAKYIILDLRKNHGGYEPIADTLLMCFLDTDTLKTYKSVVRKDNAFYAAMGYGYPQYRDYYENTALDTLSGEIYLKKDLPYFSQPLVILISEKTISAAEDLLIALKLYYPNRAILVGSPTAASTGAPFVRKLTKHNAYYRICTRKPLVPDALFANGIQPDYYYEKSIEEYMTGEEYIFDFVDEIIKSSKHESQ